MTIPPILTEADRLVKSGENFTTKAFEKHKSSCAVNSRDDFLKLVTQNFAEKYAALESIQVPDSLKADKAEYMKLLLDEAYTIKAFHDYYNKSQWTYNFQSEYMKKKAQNLSVWTLEAAYPIYIYHANSQRKIIGLKLDKSLNTEKFASLMPDFKTPQLPVLGYQPVLFNV